jgi:hypothetical protein
VRLADRTFVSRCYGDWFTPAQVEQALSRLALAADSLGYHGIQPIRLCWVFQRKFRFFAIGISMITYSFATGCPGFLEVLLSGHNSPGVA